ncbi:MAG TPA: hypothetical protein VEQ42_10720 [Pyrinomonadaceae bacterium]|nr:hypothetical protein [Pyrinomonadaceae bacterium]
MSFRRKCGGEFANSSPAFVADILKKSISGELVAAPSVTERTTRDLG